MNSYLTAITKTNSLITGGIVDIKETRKFATADTRWAKDRRNSAPSTSHHIGDVCQFDFGKNYKREMSYEHRGLIIGVMSKLYHVLPIFSYDPTKHELPCNAANNTTGNGNLYLLEAIKYPFIDHDSVLRLDMLCSLSPGRIVKTYSTGLNPVSVEYKEILDRVCMKYFPTYNYELKQAKKQLDEIKTLLGIETNDSLLEKIQELIREYKDDIE